MAFFNEPYPEDVANRIDHDYPDGNRMQVIEILERLRHPNEWLRFACLRLAQGRVALLPQWVELANRDPRDLQLAVESIAGGSAWERDYILYDKRGTRGDMSAATMQRHPRS